MLLDGFREVRNREEKAEAGALPKLKSLLGGYLASRDEWAEHQRAFADDFNLFAVMDVEHDEATHSKILAWLLDRRIMHGTHAQGSLFFRLFLEELGTDLGIQPAQITRYAEQLYWVGREVSGDKSRVDIEIAAYGQFVIHIENKITAIEGPEQTKREWDDLESRSKELGAIPTSDVHGVFLTLEGDQPQNTNFCPVGLEHEAFGQRPRPA
jgi:hypothetical protein